MAPFGKKEEAVFCVEGLLKKMAQVDVIEIFREK